MMKSHKLIFQVALAALALFGNFDATSPLQTVSNNTGKQFNSTEAAPHNLKHNETLSVVKGADTGLSTMTMNSTDTTTDSPDMINSTSSKENSTQTIVDSNSSTTVSPLADWPEDKCIDNLTNIYEDVSLKGAFEMKTYHICPNTTYVIGIPDSDGNCCDEGKHRAFEMRSYSEYICGEDGESSNNCFITGGQVHVVTTQEGWVGEPSKALKLRGFTFEKAEILGILLANEGDVEFIDCIFKVGDFNI
jgi:hypothetical protein